jgi:prophage regulatory protein
MSFIPHSVGNQGRNDMHTSESRYKSVENQQSCILRRPAVERLTGLPRSSIYAEMKKGSFPRPVKLSARAVGWLSEEIENWIKRQITDRTLSNETIVRLFDDNCDSDLF